VVNIGELREVIKIQSPEIIIDDFTGIEKEVYVDKYSLRCKRKTISSKEFYENSSNNFEVTDRFICRCRAIELSDIILYKNLKYDIKHIHQVNSDFIEITAIRRMK
jgi:head-tail adaptor